LPPACFCSKSGGSAFWFFYLNSNVLEYLFRGFEDELSIGSMEEIGIETPGLHFDLALQYLPYASTK
jgi:hypothetical protein